METSKLTAEGIIGEAVRIGAKMSGGKFPIEVFPIRIQKQAENPFLAKQPSKKKIDGCIGGTKAEK